MTETPDQSIADLIALVRDSPAATPGLTWQIARGPSGWSYDQFPKSQGGPIGRDREPVEDLVRRFDARHRPDDAGEHALVVQVSLDEQLNPSFDYSYDVDSISPCSVQFDPDYRPPRQPAPGSQPRPERAAPTAAPTDPEVLARIEALVAEYVEHYTRLTGEAPPLGEPHTEEAIAEAEARIGLRLPEDLRAVYRLVDGGGDYARLLGDFGLYSLAQVVAHYFRYEPGFIGWPDGALGDQRLVLCSAPGVIRRQSRSDWWVTVGSNFGGEECAVDLDPDQHGAYGQVIEFGRNIPGSVSLVGDSVTTLLTHTVDFMRTAEPDEFEDFEFPRPDLPEIEFHVWQDIGKLGAAPDPAALQ